MEEERDFMTLDLDIFVLSRVTSNINQESPGQATILGHLGAELEAVS